MLLPYTAGVYYGPAACAMVVEDSIGEKEGIEIRGDLRVGASSDGLGEVHYMRPIRLRGFPMDSQGLGEVHEFQPRMRARIALAVAISQLSQDDVVGALQTMPVSSEMTFAEFCTAMIAYMEQGGSAPSAADNAAAVRTNLTAELAAIADIDAKTDTLPADILSAAQVTPIHSNTKQINDAEVIGDGQDGNDWRAVGVLPQ